MEDLILRNRYKHVFQAKNGIANEANLQFAKKSLLFDSIRNHTDLIQTKSDYPKQDSVTLELSLDVAIIDYKRYKELIDTEYRYKSLEK